MSPRKIIHVDMDAFYASVEQRDRPELRGRPVVVGGPPEGRSVVAAASYEARRFGVRSAMSSMKAKRLCPDLVFIRPDFGKYVAVSEQLRVIFNSVTDLVEPLSLDEAFLDVTTNFLNEPLAGKIAKSIKARIKSELHLTASAGVGPNKLIAKLASDYKKPDGLVIVPPDQVDAFLLPMAVEKLWGVGPATAKHLHELGARTIGDLRGISESALEAKLGSFGPFLSRLAHGDDPRSVEPHRIRKSHGAERTMNQDLVELEAMDKVIDGLAARLGAELAEGRPGKTITVKVRYSDFTTLTRSRSLKSPTIDAERIAATAKELLRTTEAPRRPVRLLGVSVSGLLGEDDALQLELPLTD